MKNKQKRKLDKLARKAMKALAIYKVELDHISRGEERDEHYKGGYAQTEDGFTFAFFEDKERGNKLIEAHKEHQILVHTID